MPYTTNEIQIGLYKKLTTRNSKEDAFSAILSGAMMLIVAFAAVELSGFLGFALWVLFGLQIFGMIMKAAGWRNITLRNDEQDFLKKNLTLDVDKGTRV